MKEGTQCALSLCPFRPFPASGPEAAQDRLRGEPAGLAAALHEAVPFVAGVLAGEDEVADAHLLALRLVRALGPAEGGEAGVLARREAGVAAAGVALAAPGGPQEAAGGGGRGAREGAVEDGEVAAAGGLGTLGEQAVDLGAPEEEIEDAAAAVGLALGVVPRLGEVGVGPKIHREAVRALPGLAAEAGEQLLVAAEVELADALAQEGRQWCLHVDVAQRHEREGEDHVVGADLAVAQLEAVAVAVGGEAVQRGAGDGLAVQGRRQAVDDAAAAALDHELLVAVGQDVDAFAANGGQEEEELEGRGLSRLDAVLGADRLLDEAADERCPGLTV